MVTGQLEKEFQSFEAAAKKTLSSVATYLISELVTAITVEVGCDFLKNPPGGAYSDTVRPLRFHLR